MTQPLERLSPRLRLGAGALWMVWTLGMLGAAGWAGCGPTRAVARGSPRTFVEPSSLVPPPPYAPSAPPPPPVSTAPSVASVTPEPSLPAETFREPLAAALPSDAPAIRYGQMKQSACLAEVARRKLPLSRDPKARAGVATPMRIDGAMNGVRLVVPPASVVFGVLDCRLGLALDDVTRSLAARGVVRMSIENMYRPGAKLPGGKQPSQHSRGLAADLMRFWMADGRMLGPSHWGATIGDVACGPSAVMASPTRDSIDLRNLLCELGRKGLLHHVLTPSYDKAHESHFHVDVSEKSTRAVVR